MFQELEQSMRLTRKGVGGGMAEMKHFVEFEFWCMARRNKLVIGRVYIWSFVNLGFEIDFFSEAGLCRSLLLARHELYLVMS